MISPEFTGCMGPCRLHIFNFSSKQDLCKRPLGKISARDLYTGSLREICIKGLWLYMRSGQNKRPGGNCRYRHPWRKHHTKRPEEWRAVLFPTLTCEVLFLVLYPLLLPASRLSSHHPPTHTHSLSLSLTHSLTGFLRGRCGTWCTAKGSDVRPGVPPVSLGLRLLLRGRRGPCLALER